MLPMRFCNDVMWIGVIAALGNRDENPSNPVNHNRYEFFPHAEIDIGV